MPYAEGRIYGLKDEDTIDTAALEAVEFDMPQQLIEIETKEFSAVCPFSGLPDVATVQIRYKPTDGKIIELKSLKYYFISYRDVGIYQEGATKRIYEDLKRVLGTDELQVITRYNIRGGMDVKCTAGCVSEPSSTVV